eukprot:TRINITY_DN3606_c1_g3_i1.p1 TRINITY_DN3606_c1_g3~~TRINITY_DN3606_c1_g3_i1.p1  ORF type:complete len:142 (+),score=39.33 TRINITY_DN3606_c1_g3_i1:511-936(+)
MASDDFHAVFEEATGESRSRTAPLSGGNAEKNRSNRADIACLAAKGKKSDLSIDDLLSDPNAVNFERTGAAASKGGKWKEQVITDNVDEVERKMWQDAPKQGDYKLEDAWDHAYKELVRDQSSDSTCAASTPADDDEFDVL